MPPFDWMGLEGRTRRFHGLDIFLSALLAVYIVSEKRGNICLLVEQTSSPSPFNLSLLAETQSPSNQSWFKSVRDPSHHIRSLCIVIFTHAQDIRQQTNPPPFLLLPSHHKPLPQFSPLPLLTSPTLSETHLHSQTGSNSSIFSFSPPNPRCFFPVENRRLKWEIQRRRKKIL